MKWEGCTVFVRDASAELICEDEDVDLTIVLPEDADDSADSPPSGSMFVLYWDEEGPVAFSGGLEADGSFRLSCRSRPRRARLAWGEDRTYLEGSWEQGDERGSLRIELAN